MTIRANGKLRRFHVLFDAGACYLAGRYNRHEDGLGDGAGTEEELSAPEPPEPSGEQASGPLFAPPGGEQARRTGSDQWLAAERRGSPVTSPSAFRATDSLAGPVAGSGWKSTARR